MNMATKKDIFEETVAEWLKTRGDKKQRGEIARHICFVTGMHPKSISRRFRKLQLRDPAHVETRGRSVYYTADVTAALKDVWEVGDQACGEDLHPMIAEYVAGIKACNEWHHSDEATGKLLAMSERTVKRRVAAFQRTRGLRKGMSTTKPSDLRYIIPIFKGPWKDLPPGHGQLDTVAHCGSTVSGDYAFTVNYTDAATYWVIPRAQWNKGQEATLANMQTIRDMLPVRWCEGHPDSGGEFLNWVAKEWFEQERIVLSRSEPNKKNDNMYVEERNGHVVRRFLGWQRLDNPDVVPLMNELYDLLAVYLNHFKAVKRIESKDKVGSKYVRKYEKKAKTPYQRMLAHESVPEVVKETLRAEHAKHNPLLLKRKIDTLVEKIFKVQKGNDGI
jgi:hypothetical protein